MMFIKKSLKFLGGIILLVLAGLFIYNIILTVKYSEPDIADRVSEDVLYDVKNYQAFKTEMGDKIWPGFGSAELPLILFNDRYSFLFVKDKPDSTWQLIEHSSMANTDIYVKKDQNPQAFALNVGEKWAGSLGMRHQMNRQMYLGIREEVPLIFKYILPYFLISIKPDVHFASVHHEWFHAFQASQNQSRFLAAEASHRFLEHYPYNDSDFTKQWNKEGNLLMKALDATDTETKTALIDSFLWIRETRRNQIGLTEDQINAEKQLEWLEGLAKYVEYKTYIKALEMDYELYNFKKKNAYWQVEKSQRLKALGESGGDNRFYYSGMAMAFLLDEYSSDWKKEIITEAVNLEDLLAKAIKGETDFN